jgi:hypothetical protein
MVLFRGRILFFVTGGKTELSENTLQSYSGQLISFPHMRKNITLKFFEIEILQGPP